MLHYHVIVCIPNLGPGGDTLASGGGGDPIQTTGQKLLYSI